MLRNIKIGADHQGQRQHMKQHKKLLLFGGVTLYRPRCNLYNGIAFVDTLGFRSYRANSAARREPEQNAKRSGNRCNNINYCFLNVLAHTSITRLLGRTNLHKYAIHIGAKLCT